MRLLSQTHEFGRAGIGGDMCGGTPLFCRNYELRIAGDWDSDRCITDSLAVEKSETLGDCSRCAAIKQQVAKGGYEYNTSCLVKREKLVPKVD